MQHDLEKTAGHSITWPTSCSAEWLAVGNLGERKRRADELLSVVAVVVDVGASVYRDVLHGAGVVDSLMTALTDAAVLEDLQLVQVWMCSA